MENKSDDLVFEISDDVYLHNWFFEITLAIILALLLYFEMMHGISKIGSRIVLIFIGISSIRKFYKFIVTNIKSILEIKNRKTNIRFARRSK